VAIFLTEQDAVARLKHLQDKAGAPQKPHRPKDWRFLWPRGERTTPTMPHEHLTTDSALRFLKLGYQWAIEFIGCRRSQWASPDDAAMVAVRHTTGFAGWDRSRFAVSDNLLHWWPIGENL
jgi:hypothetical protein